MMTMTTTMTTIMSDVDVAVAEEGLLKTTEEGVFF